MKKRLLSILLTACLALSLCTGLSGTLQVQAADESSIHINDLVQVQVGESLTDLKVYRNGVYEAMVHVEAGYHTATVFINGAETDMTMTFKADAAGEVCLRVKDNTLTKVAIQSCALVGSFGGLDFVDEAGEPFDIALWDPANPKAELTYLGGGLYGRTFRFKQLKEDLTIAPTGYKVAFNDGWDYSIGDDGKPIALTIPAGSSSLTILVDEINQVVYDSVRSGSFLVAQDSDAIAMPALATTVSLIGTVRYSGGKDWVVGAEGYEFDLISDTLYRYEKTFEKGSYEYKCVFDYEFWYAAENGRLYLEEKTHVVFLYNTVTGSLYDTVNDYNAVAELIGMQAPPAQTKISAKYLDENGEEQTAFCDAAITADNIGSYGTLNAGWYVVQGTDPITINSRVTVSGDVHLILANGCDFTVNGGIQVQDDDGNITNGSDNALTIYAQSTEESTMGKLTAQNVETYNAAIGGTGDSSVNGTGGSSGVITINGGIITAATNGAGAGIGGGAGGHGGSGGSITINGGTVKAESFSGAGIGGGYGSSYQGGSGGKITINGGSVEASSSSGAGIGGGRGMGPQGGSGGEITINGGTVTATNKGDGAGIGGSYYGDGGVITITGGTVTATSKYAGSGIGGGAGSSVTHGTFQTNGGSAVIFAKSIGDQSGKASNAWSGVIFEGDEGKVYGTAVTPIEDFTIDSGKTLLIPENSELTIADITATNSGSVYVDGTLTGTVSGTGGVYYPLTVNGGTATPTYDYKSKTYGMAGETVTLTGTNIPEGQVVDSWTTSNSAVTVTNNTFTMPTSALTVTARIKTIGTVSTDDPSKVYDGQPVSMDGKYTVNGTGTVTVEYKAQNAEDATYTQSAPTDAGSYTVRISVAASDNYTAAFATQDFTITKAAQTAPDVPTVKSKTYNSVTLEQIPDNANGAKAQYSMDGGATWQDSPGFTDLTPSTAYNFVARYRETDNYFASPVSTELSVTTSAAPSSGGGSSTPTYPPTVTQPENGTVTVSPKSPKKGDTVTITPKPEAGYTVEQILVTDKNGNPVKVTNNGDGTYSFTQPAGKVNVEATFMEDNTMLNFFVDVPADAYYYDAVLWAAENGITGGVDDTHFAPNAPCTRAQIVTFLWRAAGSPVVNYAMNFSDVPADAYYAEAVRWAVSQGITTGTGDGTTFSPNATCTRAQAMTFLYRSEQAQGGGMQGEWMFLNPFSDVDLENYYGEAVMWAVANGVTSGTTDTTFSPNNNCTRAQIVTFLYRFFVK